MRWLVLVLLLAGVAVEAMAQSAIAQVQMFRDRQGEAGEAAAEFRPGDRKQHFLIELGKLELGTRQFQVRYVGEDTSAGSDLDIATADFGALVARQITSSVELEQDWPIGRYRLDLLMEGRVIGSHRYIVTPPWAAQIVIAWFLYGDASGKPSAEVERFPSSQRRLHFQAHTSGYIKRGAQLTFQLLAPDGEEVSSDELAIEADAEVFNILTYQVPSRRDWPVGRYQVKLFSGRRLLGAHEFDIVER